MQNKADTQPFRFLVQRCRMETVIHSLGQTRWYRCISWDHGVFWKWGVKNHAVHWLVGESWCGDDHLTTEAERIEHLPHSDKDSVLWPSSKIPKWPNKNGTFEVTSSQCVICCTTWLCRRTNILRCQNTGRESWQLVSKHHRPKKPKKQQIHYRIFQFQIFVDILPKMSRF